MSDRKMVRVRVWDDKGQPKVIMAEDFPLQDLDLGDLAPSALVFLLQEDLDEECRAKLRHQLDCLVGEDEAKKMLSVAKDAREVFCKTIFATIGIKMV